MHCRTLLTLLAAVAATVSGFYLPGVAPKIYKADETILTQVNALSSPHSAVPFDFYNDRLHFCRPAEIVDSGESLGSVLMGDRLHNTPLEVPDGDKSFMIERIKEDYRIHWEFDNLPVGFETNRVDPDNANFKVVELGFPIGAMDDVTALPNLITHYEFTIKYYEDQDGYRVVGAFVKLGNACNGNKHAVAIKTGENTDIPMYYSVKFEKSDTPWATRWDIYLHIYQSKVHWIHLINSVIITVLLTGMTAMILLRALHRDINRYNQVDATEDAQEDFGWKLVHGDVFRSPPRAMLLSVLLGSGAQLFIMASVTTLAAALGFLSPANRGSLVTMIVVFYVLCGACAGFVSSRFYKMFGGEQWKRNILLTATAVPGLVFTIFIILNFFLMAAGSSAAVPFGTFAALVFMWFLISVPMCFAGAYLGLKKERLSAPVRVNQIPRQIPQQTFFTKRIPAIFGGAVLPFGVIIIELGFILDSIWAQHVYYMFGLLLLIGFLLFVICAEVSIVLCYFQLCAEDYRWWWRAFLAPAASGLYVFLYSCIAMGSRFRMVGATSTVLYLGWSLVFSGFIGFVSTLLFARKIYSSIKID